MKKYHINLKNTAVLYPDYHFCPRTYVILGMPVTVSVKKYHIKLKNTAVLHPEYHFCPRISVLAYIVPRGTWVLAVTVDLS